MDNEYFKEHWYQECFKDGGLVIPDGIDDTTKQTADMRRTLWKR